MIQADGLSGCQDLENHLVANGNAIQGFMPSNSLFNQHTTLDKLMMAREKCPTSTIFLIYEFTLFGTLEPLFAIWRALSGDRRFLLKDFLPHSSSTAQHRSPQNFQKAVLLQISHRMRRVDTRDGQYTFIPPQVILAMDRSIARMFHTSVLCRRSPPPRQ